MLLAGLVVFEVAFVCLVAFCVELAVPFAGLEEFCVELAVPLAGLVAFVVLLVPTVPLALVVPFVKFRVLFAGIGTLQPHPLA